MEITKTKLEELAEIEPKEALEFGSIKIKDEEIRVTHPSNIIIHKISNELPKMSESEYKMLKKSIEEQGQLVPVYLYRGKLVDGRHRLKALKELKSNIIKFINLPNNWTLKKVKEFILGTEQRSHETKAQLAIRAYFDYKQNGGSMQDVGSKYGVDKSDISRAKKIEENLGTNILNELLEKRKVMLQNGRYYSNLKSIVQYINSIKKELKNNKKEPTNEISKKIKELADIAFINGDIDSLHEALVIIKNRYNELISK